MLSSVAASLQLLFPCGMQLLKPHTVWNSYLAAFKGVALSACEEVKFLLLVLCEDLGIVLKAGVQCHGSGCCVV